MKKRLWGLFDKYWDRVQLFFIAFDFFFAGYDVKCAIDSAPWWNLILASLMTFYGFQALGFYKKNVEREAEKIGRDHVLNKWEQSINRPKAFINEQLQSKK